MEENDIKKCASLSKDEHNKSKWGQSAAEGKVSKLGKLNEQNSNEAPLSDDQLEEIVGGLTHVKIPLCKKCKQRIAVHGMSLCATCFN